MSGGDENGFAVLAGRTEAADVVRILITNYAIPAAYLEAREHDVFEFTVPVGSIREEISLIVPPRRTHAIGADVVDYSLEVVNLPWGNGPHRVVRYRADGATNGEVVQSSSGEGTTAIISNQLAVPAVELMRDHPDPKNNPAPRDFEIAWSPMELFD